MPCCCKGKSRLLHTPEILFVSGNGAPVAGSDDALLSTSMMALGWRITNVSAAASVTADANGRDLVFISESCAAASINTKFRAVPVPVVITEIGAADDMDMIIGPVAVAAQTQVTLINTPSPFSGIDVGDQNVTLAAQTLAWGTPSAGALLWATIVGAATEYVALAYETGVVMQNLFPAPARRATYGIRQTDTAAALQTANSRGYILNACMWAMGIL